MFNVEPMDRSWRSTGRNSIDEDNDGGILPQGKQSARFTIAFCYPNLLNVPAFQSPNR